MSIAVRPPAYQALADDLRAQITSGRLRPGDRLPTEPRLGERSGVSRSTVREALRQLASQHLIVTTRGVAGGSFVAHPSPAKISESLATGVRLLHASEIVGMHELLEAREIADVAVAGLAARRRSDEHLAALRATLFDPFTTDLSTMLSQHPAFHLALAGACRNPLLELLTRPLQTVGNSRELASPLGHGYWAQVDGDHRAIFSAVEAGDAGAAEAAAARHLAHLRRILVPEQPISSARPATAGAASV